MNDRFMDEGNWEEVWAKDGELNFFGRRLFREKFKKLKEILRQIGLNKNAKIINVGCGAGRTLDFFKKNGYENSIGIDISESSMELCKERGLIQGEDIFLMDGSDTEFGNNKFDLVHSGGLLEHFKNFEPFVEEWSRISNKYILITQPNHFSFFSKVLHFLTGFKIHEYSYRIKDFSEKFGKYDFDLFRRDSYNFNEHWLLLFKKRDKH